MYDLLTVEDVDYALLRVSFQLGAAIMFRTFLLVGDGRTVPAEFSANVRRVAQLFHARLVLAEVRSPEQLSAATTSGAAASEAAANPPTTDAASCEVNTVILAGDFVQTVCDKGHEADVIVIWRGATGDADSMPASGGLTNDELSNLVRQAPRPIWLAREPVRVPEHIVVAYDGSAHSGRALHMGANLAETLGARLTVLNVDESRDVVAQELILSRAAGYCEPYRISMERVGVFGPAAPSIQSYADSSQCDLLVLGAAGVGYLRGLLFGSVTGQLITHATCSVLVAK